VIIPVTVTAPITDTVIHTSIVRAVEKVFHTMATLKVTFVSSSTAPETPTVAPGSLIIGSVGFVGDASGLIYLCLDAGFAQYVTGRILGMDKAEVDAGGHEVVNDAIGEVTNMTVGGFKNTLCDLGHLCKLTLPTIVRGQHVSIASVKSATRHIFHFECEGHRITTDIQLKLD
jgi:chemotaxis protein CheX